MASTFSTQAEDAFTRVVEVQQETELEDLDIEKNFQTEKIISFLKRKLYGKVSKLKIMVNSLLNHFWAMQWLRNGFLQGI